MRWVALLFCLCSLNHRRRLLALILFTTALALLGSSSLGAASAGTRKRTHASLLSTLVTDDPSIYSGNPASSPPNGKDVCTCSSCRNVECSSSVPKWYETTPLSSPGDLDIRTARAARVGQPFATQIRCGARIGSWRARRVHAILQSHLHTRYDLPLHIHWQRVPMITRVGVDLAAITLVGAYLLASSNVCPPARHQPRGRLIPLSALQLEPRQVVLSTLCHRW